MAHSAKIGKMGLKNQLTKTPYLVLFIVLISIGVGTASALITITLAGDVTITGFLDMTGDKITNVGTPTLNTDAATKGYVDQAPSTDTLALLGCNTDQVTRWDGSQWVCNNIVGYLVESVTTAVDTTDSVGVFTSIAIGNDSFPVISYWDSLDDNLKVAKCVNVSCTGTSTITAVDTAGIVGVYTSIAIGNDSFPVISYYDLTNEDLKVAKCVNVSCTGISTITSVDTAGDIGETTSIAIGNDGFPVISYHDLTNDNLKVFKAGGMVFGFN